MPPAECKPRQLGQISEQAEDYIRHASEDDLACVEYVLSAIEGDPHAWSTVPQAELLGTSQFGRMVALMPNSHVLVWREYVDYPSLYAIFYIGLGNQFV